jgi:hypothetical protein
VPLCCGSSWNGSASRQDASRHGVEVRTPDVLWSDHDYTLEDLPHPAAVRLGLRVSPIDGAVGASGCAGGESGWQ